MASSSSSSSSSSSLAGAFSSASARALDALYSRLTRLNGKFFADGWGDLDLVRIEAAREAAAAVSKRVAGATVAAAARGEAAADGFKPQWKQVERQRGRYTVYEARFESPAADASLPALKGPLLPRESQHARARLILPDPHDGSGNSSNSNNGIVVHLPATGDHEWSRRTRLAVPMALGPQKLGALLLEGPFYGARRPEAQRGAKVRSVADLFVLGWATIAEALLLAGWARGESERQGVCGLSMGGVHAAMSASLSPHPLAVAPLLAPRSAVFPYVDGALAPSVAVEALGGAGFGQQQVFSSSEATTATALAAADAAATAADAAAAAAEAAALPSAGPRCLRRVAAAVRAASQGIGDDAGVAAEEKEAAAGSGLGLRMPRAARALAALDALEAELHRVEAEAEAARARGGEGGGGGETAAAHAPFAPSAPATATAAAVAVASATRALRAAAAARLSYSQTPSPNPQQHTLAWGALRAALEAYTDTTRYPLPQRPDAAVLVAAVDDAYAPPHDVAVLHRHWVGSEMRTVSGGHVSAFLLHQEAFRRAIADSVARL
jgi:hypothetical protein